MVESLRAASAAAGADDDAAVVDAATDATEDRTVARIVVVIAVTIVAANAQISGQPGLPKVQLPARLPALRLDISRFCYPESRSPNTSATRSGRLKKHNSSR